jgi:hypothetical protein
MRVPVLLLICCLALSVTGCGSDSSQEREQEARQVAAREARIAAEQTRERQKVRQVRRAAARHRREAARRRTQREVAHRHEEQRRAEQQQVEAEERERAEAEESEEASECDPNYSGACLDPYASDYDCEGGSGDGPEYTGPVAVVGEDHYGLDSDNDGYACEY